MTRLTSRVPSHTHPGNKAAASHTHEVDDTSLTEPTTGVYARLNSIEGRLNALEAKAHTHTVVVPPPVDPPPVPPPFPYSSLQQAIAATPAGGVLDCGGRWFPESVRIQKPIRLLRPGIDGGNTRTLWVEVWAPDVIIEDGQFKNAAKGAVQSGSIAVSQPRFQLLRAVVVGGSYASVSLQSTETLIQDCDISGAQMGIWGWQAHNGIVKGGRIHHVTGTADPGNENGGAKIGKSTGFVIDGVEFDHNVGLGGWYDVFCSGAKFLNVKAHDNSECGLMVEVQDGFEVKGCIVNRNALGRGGNGFERNGGIFISSDENGAVSGNTVAWNGFGTPGTNAPASDITIVSQPGVHPETAPHDGIVVINNILRKAPVFYGYDSNPKKPVIAPNTIVPDTDSRIAGLK
jgi:hypothetical protein